MKKLTSIGISLSLLLGLALWRQEAVAAAKVSPGFTAKTLAATKGAMTNTLHFRNSEKRVDITVQINGIIDGYTVQSVEALVQTWLEAAHVAVVNADGADILELHIRVDVDDDDDHNDGIKASQDNDDYGDGKGWHIASECGKWDEDRDADTLEALN